MAENEHNLIHLYVHKGRNFFRFSAFIFFIFMIIVSIYALQSNLILMIIVIITSFFGIASIRIPKIYLFEQHFEIVRISIIKLFNERDIFRYSELKDVKFSEGFTDRYYVLLALFGAATTGGNSKADQMIINTLEGKTIIFNRFGKKTEFVKTIDLIKNVINSGFKKLYI